MRSELVMPLQPIMFIQRQNNSSTILPHDAKLAISYKQSLQATCLYVTVEFAILRSQSRVGVISMICGGRADAEQNISEEGQMRSPKSETPSISGSNLLKTREVLLFAIKKNVLDLDVGSSVDVRMISGCLVYAYFIYNWMTS